MVVAERRRSTRLLTHSLTLASQANIILHLQTSIWPSRFIRLLVHVQPGESPVASLPALKAAANLGQQGSDHWLTLLKAADNKLLGHSQAHTRTLAMSGEPKPVEPVEPVQAADQRQRSGSLFTKCLQ